MNIGDQILNTAYIYFDFNAPIITNTTATELTTINTVAATNQSKNIQVFPNPATNEIVQIRAPEKIQRIELLDVSGRLISSDNGKGNGILDYDAHLLVKGIYTIRIIGEINVYEQRLIKY